jgi:hypothetical protein
MGRRRRGLASLVSIGEEALKRGWFAVNAIKRLAKSDNPREQLKTERTYFEAHKRAQTRRRVAAAQDDLAAERNGDTLGWYSVLSPTTCALCRSLHGKNYSHRRGTPHGRPGTVHGKECKCFAGPPHPNGRMIT